MPLGYGRQNAHVDDFVAHLAEVLVAGLQGCHLFGGAGDGLAVYAVRGDAAGHGHHDVVEACGVGIGAYGVVEFLAAHGCCHHLDGKVSGALERAAATELDNLGATLGDFLLHLLPFDGREAFAVDGLLAGDDVDELLACYGCGRSKDGHLLAVATVGVGVLDFGLRNAEVEGEGLFQTGRVEGGEGSHLVGLQTRVDEGHETGDVGGVEDDDEEFAVGAVLLDVLAELLGNLGVAGEEVLTGHAFLAGSAAGRDDVLGILESLGGVGGAGDVDVVETALAHFFGNTLGAEYVVEADVVGEAHHACGLGHVGADHAGCAHDDEFVVSQEIHDSFMLLGLVCVRYMSKNVYLSVFSPVMRGGRGVSRL